MSIISTITFDRGEDVLLTVTMTPTTDITGWTLTFTMKQYFGDAAALITKSGSITSAVGGIFTITINSADTATLDPGSYQYDIWRTNTGYATVLTQGILKLLPETRL
jgi:hypothetical protein